MSERPESAPAEQFDFTKVMQQINSANPNMRFNRALVMWGGEIPFIIDEHEWISCTNKNNNKDKVTDIHIGAQPAPPETAKLYGWGVNNIDSEMAVRTSHEMAHAVQVARGFEQALVDILNGITRYVTNQQSAYISLYKIFTAYGKSVTGLSTEEIYKEQSIEANMEVPVIEDITELLGAYLLGDEYFYWRLNRIRGDFSDMEKLGILSLVSTIYTE